MVYYYRHFNPRFPRGKRLQRLPFILLPHRFQSTLPAGEATPAERTAGYPGKISIHASRGGSDLFLLFPLTSAADFNPRFPRGKRPYESDEYRSAFMISIHASRGGSDQICRCAFRSGYNFNPRFPRGKRPNMLISYQGVLYISIHASRGGSDKEDEYGLTHQEFQSTLPAGEAT